MWDLRTGEPVASLEGHVGPVKRVAFSPTGDFAATSTHGSMMLWKLPLDPPAAAQQSRPGGR